MCDEMTSHLFRMNDGPVVHTIHSHSATRRALGIGDKDESYCTVEWCKGSREPEIRFPKLWLDDQREDCVNWYASHMPTRDAMMRWCVLNGTNVKIVPGEEAVLDGVHDLPKCIRLYCGGCTGLTSLPALPECTTLYCDGCTGLTSLPDLPKCKWLYCGGCTGLTSLPALPECTWLSCDDRLRNTRKIITARASGERE